MGMDLGALGAGYSHPTFFEKFTIYWPGIDLEEGGGSGQKRMDGKHQGTHSLWSLQSQATLVCQEG